MKTDCYPTSVSSTLSERIFPHHCYRSDYINVALARYLLNGDAYVLEHELYPICQDEQKDLPYDAFLDDFAEQFRLGILAREGRRIYLARTLNYENSSAQMLADLLRDNSLPPLTMDPDLMFTLDGHPFSEDQRRVSIFPADKKLCAIVGGGGTGKTSIVKALVKSLPKPSHYVLCAPTGKAARNLTERTHLCARTVHSALGLHPHDDFLRPVEWSNVRLVIVDEASMLTLELLTGLLTVMPRDCHLVLLGDQNQLLSVGSGNVLPDLQALGIPFAELTENHRISGTATALQNNVTSFSQLNAMTDLKFDDSFLVNEMAETQIKSKLVQDAAQRYLNGENILVLSPFNTKTQLSVRKLNLAIRNLVNPPHPDKLEIVTPKMIYRTGDRVMITRNNRALDCSNGDIGVLEVLENSEERLSYVVALPDGRAIVWDDTSGLTDLTLAYCITVHKAQGSEADTILMPMSDQFKNVMNRNTLYTAVSRAKSKMIFYGNSGALNSIMKTPAPKRRSMLVSKTRMCGVNCF